MTCPIRNRMDQPAVEAGHLPQLYILGHVALPKRMQLAERWPSTAYRSDSVQLEMFGRTKYHCTLSQARIPGVARTVQFTCQQKRTKFHSFAMINAMINQKWELRCPTGGTLDPAGEGGGGGCLVGWECALNVGLAVPGGVVPGHKRHHPQAAYLPGCRVHPQLRAHLIDRRQLPCRAKAMTGTLVTVQMARCVCP